MYVDTQACRTFWQAYLMTLASDHPHRTAKPDSFGFGGEPALAEELAALTLAGRKRATTSLAIEYTALGEELPRRGDLSIIVGGDGRPVAIIERIRVDTISFAAVDEDYAATEGEGDGSLAYWYEAHAEYFAGVCRRTGLKFDVRMPVICQVFRVIWQGRVP